MNEKEQQWAKSILNLMAVASEFLDTCQALLGVDGDALYEVEKAMEQLLGRVIAEAYHASRRGLTEEQREEMDEKTREALKEEKRLRYLSDDALAP